MMNTKSIGVLLLLVTLLSISLVSASSLTPSKWVNVDVTRSFDLTTQLAKQTVQIKAKNVGSESTNIYTVALASNLEGSQSFQLFNRDENTPLPTLKSYTKTHNKVEYKFVDVDLKQKVSPGSTVTLKLQITSMGQQLPFPTHVEQQSVQLVKLIDNAYFTTPYETETQKTTFKLPSSKIESFTNTEQLSASAKGQVITYGPFKNVAPLSNDSITLHYENNSSFVMLTRLEKEYEVSHWGNIAVETFYWIRHAGAQIKGAFSRLDYQRNQGASPAHVAELHETVPPQAADFYYRDYIGNISTSQYFLAKDGQSMLFKITPRFPLFGGWKNEFYTGYNLPTAPFLSVDSDTGKYVLKVTAGVGFDNTYVEEHVVRFVLPEGASDITVNAPFQTYDRSESTRKTFFDTVGRVVVEVSTKFTSHENAEPITVSYSLPAFSIFREPILAISFIFAICLTIIFFTRLDLSIIKRAKALPKSPEVEKQLKQFVSLFESRIHYHQELEGAINQLARSANSANFQSSKQSIDQKYKDATNVALSKIVSNVSSLDATFSNLLKELNDADVQLTQIQQQLIDLEKQKPKQYDEIKSKLTSTYRKSFDDLTESFSSVEN